VQHAPERDGVSLAYETAGPADGEPLLLVHGLATQMLLFHDDLVAELVARGFFVVRFDNRDIGLSTHLHDAPKPDLRAALKQGDTSTAAYRLEDMADDVVGLLDHLGLPAVHVLGVSMGGMVAQTLALDHPDRVLSLTSVMSTPGPRIGPPTREASAVLLAPPAGSREEAVEGVLTFYRVAGSPAHELDEAWLREVAGTSYDRGTTRPVWRGSSWRSTPPETAPSGCAGCACRPSSCTARTTRWCSSPVVRRPPRRCPARRC
jgi:pimeloyl-ACP methyl ester carboxylesterase